MRVGFFQFEPHFGEPEINLQHVLSALSDVQADLLVLPELPFTGYYFQDRLELEQLAEAPEDSSTVQALAKLCADKNLHLVTGFAEQSGKHIFNSALAIGPHGLIAVYRKLHLFNTENEYFDQGDKPLPIIRIDDAKVGIMICYDYAFPEVARTLALGGADIICNTANLVTPYCQRVMPTRCFENSVFAIVANRHGADKRPRGETRFTGKSQIIGPRGELIHQAEPAADQLYIVEIDPLLARDKRLNKHNELLWDRRPEFYHLTS